MTEQEIQTLREERDHYQSRSRELAEQLLRLTKTAARAAETISELGQCLGDSTEALTIAAATLESAMGRIQRMEPVVAAALSYYEGNAPRSVIDPAVAAYLQAEPS